MEQAVFAFSVQGFDHIKKENRIKFRKFPCQDRSYYGEFIPNNIDEDIEIELYVKNSDTYLPSIKLPVSLKAHSYKFKIICVSDGHGSPSYFRSDRGAEFAIISLVELVSANIGKFFECYEKKDFETIEKGLSRGISYNRWLDKVGKDLLKNPISPKEYSFLEEDEPDVANRYKRASEEFFKINPDDSESVLKFLRSSELKSIYGCTFIAYIETEKFWYALQIGDGDLAISYDGIKYEKPIAEDESCIGNETTSLCGTDSFNDFRFAHGDKTPKIVLCSSDGLANSVSGGDNGLFNLYKWYVSRFTDIEFKECECCSKGEKSSYLCDFSKCRIEKAKKAIAENLPESSKNGSGDDFSLAGKIQFIEADVSNIRKFTYYRQYKRLKSSPTELERKKSLQYLSQSANLGNIDACFTVACEKIKIFEKNLLSGIYDPVKKNEILSLLDKSGQTGIEAKTGFYLKLSDYIIRSLKVAKYDKQLIDGVVGFLNYAKEGDCLYKIQLALADYYLSDMNTSLKFNNDRFEFIVKIKGKKSDIYEVIQKIVDYQFISSNPDEVTCKKLLDYYSQTKEMYDKNLKLYEQLYKYYQETGKEMCNILSILDQAEPSCWESIKAFLGINRADYYYKRYRNLKLQNPVQASVFFKKAVDNGSLEACIDYGKKLYAEAIGKINIEDYSVGIKLFKEAKTYFTKGISSTRMDINSFNEPTNATAYLRKIQYLESALDNMKNL